MNLNKLAVRYGQLAPNKRHLALPFALMAILYWLSSIPGKPLPDHPDIYALFYWMSPSLQNLLHIPAYVALGWAWRWSLGVWFRNQTGCAIAAFMLSAGHGVFDEWHQSFVPYRYASLADIALDMLGSVLGIYACYWMRNNMQAANQR